MLNHFFIKRTRIAFLGWLLAIVLIAFGTRSAAAQGAPPSGVLMQRLGGATCLNVTEDGQEAMAQPLNLLRKSHLLMYFTFEWGSLTTDEEGLLKPTLDGTTTPDFEWSFAGTDFSRTSGTVMWSFPDVPRGAHTVGVNARLEGGDGSAELNECALTVFVIP